MSIWTFRELPLFNFDRLVISWASIIHSSQKLWPFEFLRAFVVQFWASRYIMGVDHTFESKVMAVSIYRDLPCSISRVSIFGARESDIRVKSYSHRNISRASAIQFWASRYIMGVDHTFQSKVMAIWTFRELLLFNFDGLVISWAPIIHLSQKIWPFEFLRASVVQFWTSRYIMGIDHIFESKVMAVSICQDLPCWISRVSIFGARKSDIRVKSYSHRNISRASTIQFCASRYIMGVDHTFE